MSATLSDIIDARRADATIRVGPNQVLAIDVADDFAAIFRLDLGPNGEARAEATIARRDTFGHWVEIVSGGTSCRVPQPFTRDGLGAHLNVLCTTGANTFLHDDTELETIAAIGIASSDTDTVLLRTADADREVSVEPSGAFAIVAIRRVPPCAANPSQILLTPRRHGLALSEPRRI